MLGGGRRSISKLISKIAELLYQEMLDHITKYDVDAAPEKVFSLKDVPEAHEYLESSRSFGKVVVLIDHE